jgi:hypothetical protein
MGGWGEAGARNSAIGEVVFQNRRLRSHIDGGHSLDGEKSPRALISDRVYAGAEPLVKFIQHFLDLLGGPMIDLAAGILLNRELYTELASEDSNDVAENLGRVADLQEDIESLPPLHCRTYYLLMNLAREGPREESSTPPPTPPHSPSMQAEVTMPLLPSDTDQQESNKAISALEAPSLCIAAELPDESEDYQEASVSCECLLDELMFYLIRLNFPQTLINLLLSLLPNQQYKVRCK